jgi:hypothetical protein
MRIVNLLRFLPCFFHPYTQRVPHVCQVALGATQGPIGYVGLQKRALRSTSLTKPSARKCGEREGIQAWQVLIILVINI